jgi:glycosyltransferase involved in cell wall biosynthesis
MQRRHDSVSAPTFSVIVPTFNRPAMLREAVDSVLAQTEPDLECIVVDDGGTHALVLPEDPRIRRVRHDANLGKAAALNTGLGEARGALVAFLDDDDLYAPDRLAVARAAHDGADVVVCGSAWLGTTRSKPPRDLQGNVFDSILEGITPHVDAVSVRREVVPAFNTEYLASQDVEWWLRLAKRTTVRTVTSVGCLIRRHSGVRHGNDRRARIEFGRRLLDEQAAYFTSHPRAEAFRWFRLGLLAASVGDRRQARQALTRSLRSRWRPRVAAHLVKVLVVPTRALGSRTRA